MEKTCYATPLHIDGGEYTEYDLNYLMDLNAVWIMAHLDNVAIVAEAIEAEWRIYVSIN